MQAMIEFIARNLVDDAEAVEVLTIREDRFATVLGLHVNSEDLGKVIGRQGRVAKAMRTLMRAAGGLQGKRHLGLEIDDRGQRTPESAPEQVEPTEPEA